MEKNIYDSIAREIQGDSNGDEALISWRQKDSYNESVYQSIWSIWVKYGELPPMAQIDLEQAWQKQLELSTHSTSSHKYWYGVAAAVLVLIISVFVLRNNAMYQTDEEVLAFGLPDSSQVWLNYDSKMNYELKDGNRVVDMQGEGFFDVKKNAELPFVISNADFEIKVVGTSFNVKYREDYTEVTVISGIVEVGNNNEKLRLLPGKAVFYDHHKQVMLPIEASQNALAWKTGQVHFSDTPISEVINDLEDYYKTELSLTNGTSASRITAHFDHAGLEEVILTIETISGEKINRLNNE
ncbi:MAG: FecR domain-containing protein [Reichenbachiella sp.]